MHLCYYWCFQHLSYCWKCMFTAAWTCCRALPCSRPHSKQVAFHITWPIVLGGILKGGMCCLQNLEMSARCYACFLEVGNTRCDSLSFVLEGISWTPEDFTEMADSWHLQDLFPTLWNSYIFVKISVVLATFWSCCPFIMITSIYRINVVFHTSMNPCLTQHMLLEPLLVILG